MEPVRDSRAAPNRAGGPDPGDELLDEAPRSVADELIDDLLPPELDWRALVRRHPIPALLVAAAGGYLLARARGPKLVDALTQLAALEVGSRVTARIADLEDAAGDDLD
jgi:hypothetical protein